MSPNQIAAQLYTVRDHCQTSEALAATAKKLRAIGYRAVQISGVGPIPEAEVVRIMAGEGLVICATHEPALTILDRPEEAVERLQKLGCKLSAYPFPKDIDFSQFENIQRLAARLEYAGDRFAAAGLTLGYHNHAIEFVKFAGVPALDYIFSHTTSLVGELDTFWIHYGGGDVVEWIEKMHGRLPFIHLKDYGYTAANTHTWCELGRGTLNWSKILPAAQASGCEWYIVEQDTCPGSPFESLRISFDYLTANFVKNP